MHLKIESTEITLASGSRGISFLTINNDSLDLREFKDRAHAGDRIVVQKINVSDTEDFLLPDNTLFTIKVK